MDEWIEVLDEDGEKTGETLLKSEVHRRGLWHRCFHCWIVQTTPDGPYLLLQRRAAGKETWPGWLDVSVAGHISAGEDSLSGGVREISEEVGLTVSPDRLVPLGTRRVDYEVPVGRDREFHDVFVLLDDTPLSGLRLQREEVDAVISVPLREALDMARGAVVEGMEFGHNGDGTTAVNIRDFVAGSVDDYVEKVVLAAERVSAGEDVGEVFSPHYPDGPR